MEEKNVTKISLSTFLLIIAIIAIIVMGILIYKLNNDKTTEIQKSTQLQSQVNSLNGTVSDLQGKITNISETINSSKDDTSKIESNSDTEKVKNENNNEKTSSCIEIGFEQMIVVLEGTPYVIPIHRPDWGNAEEGLEPRGVYYYNKFEIDNIKSGVKKVYAEVLGTDPSTSIYFVMEDGSVRILESSGKIPNIKYTSKEVVSSSNNVVELKMDGNILNAITKDGKIIKIAEAMA